MRGRRYLAVLLVLSFGCAQAPTREFVSADFLPNGPGRLGWLDEDRVVFSIGPHGMEPGTDCRSTVGAKCDAGRSIRIWNTRDETILVHVDDAALLCVSRGRIAFSKNGRLYTQALGGTPEDTGLEAARAYSWKDCVPSKSKTPVGKNSAAHMRGPAFRQYYDFMRAHFAASRYGYSQTKITWYHLDGTKAVSFMRDGPWNKSDRHSERYFPTKVGIVVVEPSRNFLVTSRRYGPFFPGIISSDVAVSPSGCKAGFFGTAAGSGGSKTEVRLYAVTLC